VVDRFTTDTAVGCEEIDPAVAEIWPLPAATPVTSPVPLMVAALRLSELQSTVDVMSCVDRSE
jgi:hypothetical protein